MSNDWLVHELLAERFSRHAVLEGGGNRSPGCPTGLHSDLHALVVEV
jgi:hypothetical protein